MDFCNDATFRGQIADKLATKLFGCDSSIVLDWYNKTFIPNRIVMPGLATPSCNINPAISTLPNLSLFASCKYLGHDLPVWLSNGNNVYDTPICSTSPLSSNHRVMVIGQDPLRNAKGRDLVMSPWGLHYPSGFSKHKNVYDNLFNPMLQKGWEIYVTDYFKLYAVDQNDKKLVFGSIFDDILRAEIEAFNPDSILVLSSDWRKYKPVIDAINVGYPGKITTTVISFKPSKSPTPTSTSSINVVCASHPNNLRGKGVKAAHKLAFYAKVMTHL